MIEGGPATPQPSAFMGDESALDPVLHRVVKACSPRGLHVDLGCGRGRLLALSRDAGHDVLGLDLDQDSVAYCRKRGLPAEVADARSGLSSLTSSLGTVSAVHLVEHLSPDDADKLFASVAEALPVGGRFIVVTPNFRDWRVAREVFWLDPTHVRPYPRPLLSEIGTRHGLRTTQSLALFGLARRYRMRAANLAGRLTWGTDFGKMNSFVVLERASP